MPAVLRSVSRFAFLLTAAIVLAHPAMAADVEIQLDTGDGFVIKDNTGAIERLHVGEATGNVSRNGALFVHTTGATATFLGKVRAI